MDIMGRGMNYCQGGEDFREFREQKDQCDSRAVSVQQRLYEVNLASQSRARSQNLLDRSEDFVSKCNGQQLDGFVGCVQKWDGKELMLEATVTSQAVISVIQVGGDGTTEQRQYQKQCEMESFIILFNYSKQKMMVVVC